MAAHLRVKLTEKIQRVGVVRIELRHVLKGGNGGVTFAKSPVGEPEVVPRTRILRLLACHIEERVAGLIEPLRLDERDAFIQARGK